MAAAELMPIHTADGMETDASSALAVGSDASSALTTGSAAADDAQEKEVVQLVDDMRVVINMDGELGLTREPRTVDEYRVLFSVVFNDWVQRIERDPTWRMLVAAGNNAATPLYELPEAEQLMRMRLFHQFLMSRHDTMLTAKNHFYHQTLMVRKTGLPHARTLCGGKGVNVLPVGIDDGLAWVLLSAPDKPTKFYIACADLTAPVVHSTGSLMAHHGTDNVTENMLDQPLTQQYDVDENFFIHNVRVLSTNLCGRVVTMVVTDVDAYDQPTGPLSVVSYAPGLGALRVRLGGTSHGAHAGCVAASYMMVVAVALPDQPGGAASQVAVYRLDQPDEPPYLLRRTAMDDAGAAVEGAVANVTALAFDANYPGRLVVAYDDLTASSWALPSPAECPAGAWAEQCTAAAAQMMTRRVGPTAEAALRSAELQPELAKIDQRQPLAWMRLEMGLNGRLLGVAPNNTWCFTRDAHAGAAQTPTIADTLAATNGIHLGTLPLVQYPGHARAVSLSSAGNYALVHFFGRNHVQLLSLRDNTVLWATDLSRDLEAMHGRPNGADNDPYAPRAHYTSTWAALGRAAVLLPNGDLYLLDGMKAPTPAEPVDAATL